MTFVYTVLDQTLHLVPLIVWVLSGIWFTKIRGWKGWLDP